MDLEAKKQYCKWSQELVANGFLDLELVFSG